MARRELRIEVGGDLLTLDEYNALKRRRRAVEKQHGRCPGCQAELGADAVLMSSGSLTIDELFPSVLCVECAAAEGVQLLERELYLDSPLDGA